MTDADRAPLRWAANSAPRSISGAEDQVAEMEVFLDRFSVPAAADISISAASTNKALKALMLL